MFTRLLTSGLIAGVLAGICVSGIQEFTTTPLILKAETYEKAAEAHHHAAVHSFNGGAFVLAHGTVEDHAAAKSAEAKEWEPQDGLQRTLFASAATIGAAVGFALMLLAVMLASDATVTASTAALWGAAGFVATGLAPGLGLAPELPGSVSADLFARQVWWIATASLTGVGLWSIWRWQSLGPVLGGIALIAVPHVWGAPHPAQFGSTVPAELASHFTSSSLAIQAILWVLVGALSGYVWQRQSQQAGAP